MMSFCDLLQPGWISSFDRETLALIWFVILAILLTGYAILDGFDLGVGILHPFVVLYAPTTSESLMPALTGDDIDFDVNPGTGLVVLENRFLLGVRHYINIKAVSIDAIHGQAATVKRNRPLDRDVMLNRRIHFESIAQRARIFFHFQQVR